MAATVSVAACVRCAHRIVLLVTLGSTYFAPVRAGEALVHEAQTPQRYVQSSYHFQVWVAEPQGLKLQGETPWTAWRGVPIPSAVEWYLIPTVDHDHKMGDCGELAREAIRLGAEGLDLTNEFADASTWSKHFGDAAPFRYLRLSGVNDACLADLGRVKNLEVLVAFNFAGTAEGLARLKACSRLRRLELRGDDTVLTDALLPGLAGLAGLRELILNGSEIADAGLVELAKHRQLTSLRIESGKLTGAGLRPLGALKNLRRLDLPLSTAGPADFEPLRGLPLEFLRLGAMGAGELYQVVNPVFTGLEQVFESRVTELGDAERQAAEALLKQLDDESFEKRDAARVKLFEMGMQVAPWLQARMKRLKQDDVSLELQNGIAHLVRDLRRALVEGEKREVAAGLDAAVKEAPRRYLAPDPVTQARMEKSISFEFVDKPLPEAAAWLAEESGLPILIDPKASENGFASITLRVSEMPVHLCLDWVGQLCELERVVRGNVAVLTSEDRANRLRLQERKFDLPVGPGGEAWTLADTEALAEYLATFPTQLEGGPDGVGCYPLGAISCAADGAGRVVVQGDDREVAKVPGLLTELALPLRDPLLEPPDFVRKRMQAAEVGFQFPDAPATDKFQSLLDAMENVQAGSVALEHHLAKDGIGGLRVALPKKEMKGSEVLLLMARTAQARIEFRESRFLLVKAPVNPNLDLVPQTFDLGAVLKAGVDLNMLRKRIEGLLREGGLPPAEMLKHKHAYFFHGRCVGLADAWTAQRIGLLLQETRRLGKLPERDPPAPWWFATFSKP